ncbi:PP2C family protein-serine/threonine phosphatase [Streptomyces mirabilis]|uniref:PP2C family protein-serine/threonine phosphatase n=1 Tax=Streptomyces mirabilis TaxID=68239 RepID=UPI0033D7CB2F
MAGALEPADHVGGDTFDYVIDRDTVQLSVTDAMGHDVDSALLATLAVGALRRARRTGAGLAEQARQADQAMREHGRQSYVTGQLLRISLIDGRTEFINACHPWPLRMRNGHVQEITPKVDTSHLLGPVAGPAADLIVGTRALHPREAARALIAAIVDANHGHLQDDATVMCLD